MIRVRDIVLLHFALNPDDELTREDIATKADVGERAVWDALQTMLRDGLIETSQAKRFQQILYRPGPELLRLIGAPR